MAYTVKKLAEISGVSIRTLHFYDEIGLLRPAYHGNNGYRYYEEEQLLNLQQILFFRELGFELKKIQKVLGKSDFDKISALYSHRKVLEKNAERAKELIATIDKTINHLKGVKPMKDQEMYEGFGITKEEQAEYEQYWKNRLGEDHPTLKECETNTKKWSKAEWEKIGKDCDQNMQDLAKLKEKQVLPNSPEVQKLIRKHYEWLKNFWTPNRESYTQLGEGYTQFEWKKFFKKYDPDHPQLAMYLAEGMRVFAEKNLS